MKRSDIDSVTYTTRGLIFGVGAMLEIDARYDGPLSCDLETDFRSQTIKIFFRADGKNAISYLGLGRGCKISYPGEDFLEKRRYPITHWCDDHLTIYFGNRKYKEGDVLKVLPSMRSCTHPAGVMVRVVKVLQENDPKPYFCRTEEGRTEYWYAEEDLTDES